MGWGPNWIVETVVEMEWVKVRGGAGVDFETRELPASWVAPDPGTLARARTWQRRQRARQRRQEREFKARQRRTGPFNPIRGIGKVKING